MNSARPHLIYCGACADLGPTPRSAGYGGTGRMRCVGLAAGPGEGGCPNQRYVVRAEAPGGSWRLVLAGPLILPGKGGRFTSMC